MFTGEHRECPSRPTAGTTPRYPSAAQGFPGRIGNAVRQWAEELGEGRSGRRVTALTATACGITTRPAPAQQLQRREEGVRLLRLLRLLEEHTTGLVMAVDDIHATDREEITRPAADVQHCVRAGLPTGLVLAGPPAAVPDQLDEGVATFLRRADRIGPHAASAGDAQPSAPRVRETPSRPRSAQKGLPSCDVLRSGAPGGPGGLAPAGGERLGHRRAAATRPGRCRLGRPP
jgi:hypothetical protein